MKNLVGSLIAIVVIMSLLLAGFACAAAFLLSALRSHPGPIGWSFEPWKKGAHNLYSGTGGCAIRYALFVKEDYENTIDCRQERCC